MVNMTTFIVILLSVLTMVFSLSKAVTNGDGFSIQLVHRESKYSPFYNSSETHFDRLRRSATRSMSRVSHFSVSSSAESDTIVSQVIPNAQPDYLMKLSLGTPPVELLAIADTGSDLTWAQCSPCLNCYKQDLPLFDPATSSTYRETSCISSPCQSLESSDYAKCANNTCQYKYTYADLSETNGVLATETFNFDSSDVNQRSVLIPTVVFGCGHSNTGLFTSWGSGLVGLGGGPLSLVSQLSSKIGGKFSYCLVDMSGTSTSKLNFGGLGIVMDMVSTPLVLKEPVTFYYLTLEAISVSGQRLENKPMNDSSPTIGNIVIDSGSTLTTVPKLFYNQLESAVRSAIPEVPIQDPSGTFNLCYSTASDAILDKLPEMIFHFSGADVLLTNLNAFALDPNEKMVCLTIAPTDSEDDVSIYGNLAQMNFMVEYDLVRRKVSFAPTDCTQH